MQPQLWQGHESESVEHHIKVKCSQAVLRSESAVCGSLGGPAALVVAVETFTAGCRQPSKCPP